MKPRVAVVTPIPTPYRDPFWRCLQEQRQVELDVYYLAGVKPDRPWDVDWVMPEGSTYVPGINLAKWRGEDASSYWNASLNRRLKTGSYEAIVIGGYNHPSLLMVMQFAQRHGIPWYLMCETFRIDGKETFRGRVRDAIVRRVVASASGFYPTGVRAGRFLQHYGAQKEALVSLPNVPDIAAIAEGCAQLRRDRSKLRRRLGVGSEPLVLFVGRLIPKKKAAGLIAAFARFAEGNGGTLAIIGDGPTREELESNTLALGIADRVLFTGFLQPSAVLEWYAAADVFALPSAETWGVAPIEALSAGLPVVISEATGCADDLHALAAPVVQVVVPDDLEMLANAIGEAIQRGGVAGHISQSLQPWLYRNLANRFCEPFLDR